MTALLIVIVAVAIFVLLGCFYHLDRLIRAEHDFYHDAWVADGRPFFVGVREPIGLQSHFAWMRASWVWLFCTPAWAHSSADHMRRLRLLRLFVLAWNVPFVILALCIVIFACLSH
jgi:hypothetical protein